MTAKNEPAEVEPEEPEESAEEQAPEPFIPTPAEDYPTIKKELELRLPSGARVIVRRVSKYEMMRKGGFPKALEAAIREAATGGAPLDFDQRVQMVDHMLCRAYVNPPAHITPKKDHVCVYDLPDADRELLVMILGITAF